MIHHATPKCFAILAIHETLHHSISWGTNAIMIVFLYIHYLSLTISLLQKFCSCKGFLWETRVRALFFGPIFSKTGELEGKIRVREHGPLALSDSWESPPLLCPLIDLQGPRGWNPTAMSNYHTERCLT